MFFKCLFLGLFFKAERKAGERKHFGTFPLGKVNIKEAVKRIGTRHKFSRENSRRHSPAPAPALEEVRLFHVTCHTAPGTRRPRHTGRTSLSGGVSQPNAPGVKPRLFTTDRPITRRNVTGGCEYSSLFARFECHVVVSREK